MIIVTDDTAYAESIFETEEKWRLAGLPDARLEPLVEELFASGPLFLSSADLGEPWSHAFIVRDSSSSQFDLLVELSRRGDYIPHGVVCAAGAGQGFHGQKGRPWAAYPGNIHLSVFLSPRKIIEGFHTGFSILAAVSIIDAIDHIDGLRGRAGIKWVNDVLIEGAKVAGFLAQTSSIESAVNAAVVGIGLNVETTPRIHADVFVPRVAALRDFIADPAACNRREVLRLLLGSLAGNYDVLLDGGIPRLLDAYRERSLVIGRNVRILSDTAGERMREIAAGRVESIGDNLELILENIQEPVTRGRLILED